MIEFHPLSLADKAWIDRHVLCENSPSADYNFGNMFMWDGLYRQQVCRLGERTLTALCLDSAPAFVYPVGSGPLRPAVDALRAYAAERGWPFRMYGVTEEHRALLEREYPGRFVFSEEEDYADYLYEAEKLASFSGKALHGKKNHCNRFEAEHDWAFLPLTREWIPACLAMLDAWTRDNRERLDGSIVYEHEAIERAFQYYEPLGLEGGVLLADGEVLGFSFGEMACRDAFNTHVEKAAADINGAYPMVCRELARMLLNRHPELRLINREDDMGLEALRASKQSYRPVALLKKYVAVWNDERLADS